MAAPLRLFPFPVVKLVEGFLPSEGFGDVGKFIFGPPSFQPHHPALPSCGEQRSGLCVGEQHCCALRHVKRAWVSHTVQASRYSPGKGLARRGLMCLIFSPFASVAKPAKRLGMCSRSRTLAPTCACPSVLRLHSEILYWLNLLPEYYQSVTESDTHS